MSHVADVLVQQLAQAAPDQRMRVIVRHRGQLSATTLRSAPGTRVVSYQLLPFTALEASAADIRSMSENPDIEEIWLDLPVHIWLDKSVPLIGAPQVWHVGYQGQGIVVGVVDTGVDVTHPDLEGRVAKTQDFSGEGFQDNHGHGTHVAGIIAGNGTASGGVYTGVAPQATIIAAKVLKGNGSGQTSDVMAGVEWAANNGAQVINLSLGSDGACDGTDALSQMCDAAVARGIVVCIAAGNAGPASGTVGSPGCARQVITIGATDDNDQVASFSSRGPTADGRLKPDLCFPGVNITSARAKGTSMGQVVNDSYTTASGTSMATPHCAGSVALLLEADHNLAPQAIKDLLIGSAKNLSADPYAQGAGRAQIYEAYLGHVSPKPPPPVPPPSGGTGCSAAIAQILRRLTTGT
jgi:subtilisin family serine protease